MIYRYSLNFFKTNYFIQSSYFNSEILATAASFVPLFTEV